MFKIGIIGIGMMGRVHTSRYLQLPNAQLTAIADISPEKLEAKHVIHGNIAQDDTFNFDHVAKYASGDELIAQADVDVIDICLPSYLHAEYAIKALAAGRHVLGEKPMALTVPDADRMIAAAKQADRRLMIAQCVRFWPEYLFIREHVQKGTFGKLLSLNMYRLGGRPIWSWDNWFLDPARSGGPIIDLQLHDIDFVNHVFGLPDRIQATGRKSPATGSYDTIHALFSYDDGPQIHIRGGWSMAQIPFQAGFDAWFERGFVRFDGRNDPPLQVFANPNKKEAKPAEYEPGDAYYNEIAYFLNRIETGAPPDECLPQSTRDSIQLIEQTRQAIESGETIKQTH